jgi:two-component system CheB/CheR fusion protein
MDKPGLEAVRGFPVVGIGASAGGLAAFEAFFSGMPADTDPGMAFVLVQHLAPDHKSLLAELIGRCTRMPVSEVEDGVVVQANCVYVIPPNCNMALLQGVLHLLDPAAPRGQRLPIDFFFQSLAADWQEQAIGIVLSGTGSDGSLGLRAIKEAGGLVMAQSIGSCEYDGMPQSAIATGLVDYQLPPADMPARLIAYAAHALPRLIGPGLPATPRLESALKKVFIVLRAQTGHDFSQYKPSSVQRRIMRRMAVQQIETLDVYVNYLQQTPVEAQALFHDLLIGVTGFFRDPEAFLVLQHQVLPKLLANKPAGSLVRVWCPGCSTGEEAYSLAMLLVEQIEAIGHSLTVQVFATDIDSRAIAQARAGLYPASIATDVSAQRLARFFVAGHDGADYRIHKSLRDMLVFSEQDLIRDPPFSRLDLISCRNLLIYLNADLLKMLIPLFHFALNPGGVLFLGNSEGLGELEELFEVLDRPAKLYRRNEDRISDRRTLLSRFMAPQTAVEASLAAVAPAKTAFPARPPLRQLIEQTLLAQVAPASALVNAAGDILYLHGRTGSYLEPCPGAADIQNILKMARDGLRPALSLALRQAANTGQGSDTPAILVKTNGHDTWVKLGLYPVAMGPGADPPPPLYLVTLQDTPAAQVPLPGSTLPGIDTAAQARIETLTRDLQAQDAYLQNLHEEMDTGQEELKSSNEEMQSVNEELQSTNEELETAKEELQSVNEELATVNAELQTRVGELTRANNDMNNLLAGADIGMVFVDFQLRILRFTPAISRIINLIPADVGRPVGHIIANLPGYNSLVADLQAVLKTLLPKEVEVQTQDGQWFTLRILPYRTLNNVIEGAVISFVNISETVRVREALRQANDPLRLAVVRDAHDAVTVQDLDGRTLAWNPGAVRLYGWSEQEALQMNVRERIPEGLRPGALAQLAQLSRAEVLQAYPTQRLTQQGVVLQVAIISTALINEAGQMYAIATTERPLPGDPA